MFKNRAPSHVDCTHLLSHQRREAAVVHEALLCPARQLLLLLSLGHLRVRWVVATGRGHGAAGRARVGGCTGAIYSDIVCCDGLGAKTEWMKILVSLLGCC